MAHEGSFIGSPGTAADSISGRTIPAEVMAVTCLALEVRITQEIRWSTSRSRRVWLPYRRDRDNTL